MSELNLRDYSAAAFDFDGTLTIGDLHTQARLGSFISFAETTGDQRFAEIDPELHSVAHEHGSAPRQIYTWLLHAAGLIDSPTDFEHDYVRDLVEEKKRLYKELISVTNDKDKGHIEVDGASGFVKQLMSRMPGKLGIVTTAHSWEVTPFIIKYKLMNYFPANRIVTVEDLSSEDAVKPNPQAYEIFLGRLGIYQPEDLLVIEDSKNGIESAKRAGATVVAIATTNSVETLQALTGFQEPDHIVESYDNLRELVGLPTKKI